MAVGDSLCSVNPIYAQGMTTAGLIALALDRSLREQRRNHSSCACRLLEALPGQGGARHRRSLDDGRHRGLPLSVSYSEVEGKRPFGQSFMEWYLCRVHQVVERDTTVALCFLRVMHMLAPPTALLAPTMMAWVLAGGFPRASAGGA